MTLEDKLPAIGSPEWKTAEEKYAKKTLVQDTILGGIITAGGIALQVVSLYERSQERAVGNLPLIGAALIGFGAYYIAKAHEWHEKRNELVRKLNRTIDG